MYFFMNNRRFQNNRSFLNELRRNQVINLELKDRFIRFSPQPKPKLNKFLTLALHANHTNYIDYVYDDVYEIKKVSNHT